MFLRCWRKIVLKVTVGGTNLFDRPVFVHVRFTSNSSGISGLTNIQPWKVGNRPGETTALYPMSNNKFFFGFSVVQQPSPDFATWTFEKGDKGEIVSTVRVQGQPVQPQA